MNLTLLLDVHVIDHQYAGRGSGHYSMSPVTAHFIKLSEFEASATGSVVSDDVFALSYGYHFEGFWVLHFHV